MGHAYLACGTLYPKTQRLKTTVSSYFTILWAKNSDRVQQFCSKFIYIYIFIFKSNCYKMLVNLFMTNFLKKISSSLLLLTNYERSIGFYTKFMSFIFLNWEMEIFPSSLWDHSRIKKIYNVIPWRSCDLGLHLPMQGGWVQSLVWELWSHMPVGQKTTT